MLQGRRRFAVNATMSTVKDVDNDVDESLGDIESGEREPLHQPPQESPPQPVCVLLSTSMAISLRQYSCRLFYALLVAQHVLFMP